MKKPAPEKKSNKAINEDWLSVFLAFLILLLSVIGVLGEAGIQITF
jgi:hypothetical protein